MGSLQVAGLLLNEVKAWLNALELPGVGVAAGLGRRAGLGGRRVPWGGRVLLRLNRVGWDGCSLSTG